MKKRIYMEITGRVQGVGFRYTAQHIANSLELTGWVKNEYDGSVSLEVQGEENTIEKLISKISESPWIYIEHIFKKNLAIKENETYFKIVY